MNRRKQTGSVCINVARRGGGGGAVAIKIHFKSVTETNHF